MAKLTDRQKGLLLADYHTNSFSQRELAKKYCISVGTVSKLTKEISPKNEHLVNAQMSILRAESDLEMNEMNAIMNTAKDKLYNEGLVISPSQKLLKLVDKTIDNNKITDKINVGMGVQNLEPRELNTTDFRNLADTIDKASVTLGVSERFSTSKVEVNQQQNNQTSNEITITRIGK